jgi:hypothetical protein
MVPSFMAARQGQRRILLRHGGRKFLLNIPRNAADTNFFNGRLHPIPELEGTRSDSFGTGDSRAYLDFCIIRNRLGKFQGIGVPDEHHRQGWASDMVRALLSHYPGIGFQNSSLNDMSGPLFMKLRDEMPHQIAPIKFHADGYYEVLWAAAFRRDE